MTRRIATTVMTTAALLVLPASAHAVESVWVSGGVLHYVSGAGTVDTVTLASGSAGKHLLTETSSPSGTVGTGCLYVGGLTAECGGATTASLDALDGDDVITVTSSLPTVLAGGGGGDTLTGGPAADTILGGDGADTIDARGGGVDTVDCGPGVDSVQADAADVLSNCDLPPAEKPQVDPPADPPVDPPVDPPADLPVEPTGEADPVKPPEADPPAEKPGKVDKPDKPGKLPVHDLEPPKLDAPVVTVEIPAEVTVGADGVVTFAIVCAATEAGGCRGDVFLDPAPRGRKGKPRALAARRGRYGRTRFAVAAGAKGAVRLSLAASARRALGLPRARTAARMARRGRPVKAVVTVAPRGKRPVKSKVTIKRH